LFVGGVNKSSSSLENNPLEAWPGTVLGVGVALDTGMEVAVDALGLVRAAVMAEPKMLTPPTGT